MDRTRSTAARRDQIVAATITVLAERGYAAASYDAICEVAELSSKRLISYHFSTKDELLAEVLRRVTADAAEVMRPAIEAATGPDEKLAAYIRSNIEFIAARPDHVRAVQQIVFGGAPVPTEEADAAVARLAALFQDGQRTGFFRKFDTLLMAYTVRAAIDAAAGRLIAGAAPENCATELAETFRRATRIQR
ncbi:TetR/AcrR family transcriptional regulator [Kribbella kalugense]|uniref:TetR family transcriptional regulator n=1 Tax=Kribbella kalugense TaxID=2512221 RepID=A0A4R7ZL36_9ACTN|nr:TetR/AcrR family transcriptional regulator [Kribbella kalugense]TDW18509.1 TetR family transcriptional regulator [Kribbella kalugense]